MTAEEYATLPSGPPTELVRGRIVTHAYPESVHGYYCANVGGTLYKFVRPRELGRVISNNCGVITERDPDTVRGPDISYFSYAAIPKGVIPNGYPPVSPELVFEVNSPSDRWPDVLAKVGEYLKGGVRVACVLDPPTMTLHVYRADAPPARLAADDDVTFPDLLPDFRVTVRQLFE